MVSIHMTSTDKTATAEGTLRQRAEGLVQRGAVRTAENLEPLSPNAMQQMIHDLRVHQIELEMQNEELRRTQVALDSSRAHYADFYDQAPVGHLTVSEHGLVLRANLTTAKLLGVSRSTLAKQAINRFIDTKDQDIFYLFCKKLLESGEALSCELQMVKHDGSRFSVRLDAVTAPAQDNGGAPTLWFVLTDVTVANHAMAEIAATKKSEAFKQAILNSVNAEVAVLDQDGIIRAVNEPWLRFALENSPSPGTVTPQTGIGTNYLAACQPDIDNPANNGLPARIGIQQVLDGTRPSFTLEYPCHSPDQQRWFSMCALPLGTHRQVGITVTHTNITAQKQSQEALRIAAAAFEVREAIMVTDSQHHIVRVNQAFEHVTGYKEQDVLGKTTLLLESTLESPEFYENFWREMTQIGTQRGGCWLVHKNGKDFFALGTSTVVKDDRGDITHYVVVFSDGTETFHQKRQQKQHEAMQREALLREVHHRIKNNLQGLRGLLQQLGSQKPEIAEQMQLVMGHIQGISVIHGLQGRRNNATVRLCELTSEIADAASTLWGTPIMVEIPSGWIPRVVAEKESVALALVLNELIVNAIKHGGQADGQVSTTLGHGRGEADVHVTILNKGQLPDKLDQFPDRHHGLQLIKSLLPLDGTKLVMTQCGDHVCTVLEMTAPVVTLDLKKQA